MAVSAEPNSAPGSDAPPTSWAVVANANAGALLGDASAKDGLRTLFERAGIAAPFISPDAGTLPERITLARETGAECVVVAGGDGTIACAASQLAQSGTILGIIPCGTMNLLAKDLHIPAGDMAEAVAQLARGRIRAIDAGMVDSPSGEHIFLCASMLGTPARLSRHREAGRRQGNGPLAWAGFAKAAWRALRRNANMSLTLRHDGGTIRIRSPSVTITVNPLDDAASLFGRSNLDAGTLAIYVVQAASPLRQLKLLFQTILSRGLSNPQISIIETKTVEIQSRSTAMHVLLDGEHRLLRPPLRYTIRPKALRIVVPVENDAGVAQ